MKTRKHLLIVARESSTLAQISGQLLDDDFEVEVCGDAEESLNIVRDRAQLSIIAVDGELVEDANRYLCDVRDSQRDLPVIWNHPDDNKPRFTVDPPNALFAGAVDLEAFTQRALGLVFHDYYPPAVVHGLVSSGNSVLARSCETGVEVGIPWLKQTEGMPGEIHAYLAFFSENVSGQIMTSGDIDVLAALGELLGFDPEEGKRQVAIDMAGEIGNQALGRMKSICGDVLAGIRMGVPVVWSASGVKAQFASEKPNIAVTLHSEFGPIYLEFGFTRMEVEDKDAGLGDEYVASGEVELF